MLICKSKKNLVKEVRSLIFIIKKILTELDHTKDECIRYYENLFDEQLNELRSIEKSEDSLMLKLKLHGSTVMVLDAVGVTFSTSLNLDQIRKLLSAIESSHQASFKIINFSHGFFKNTLVIDINTDHRIYCAEMLEHFFSHKLNDQKYSYR